MATAVTAEFEYNGRHFVPVGKLTEDYDTAIKHTRSNYNRERNAYLFDGKPWDYKRDSFYAAAKTKADVFRCIENGKIYIPGENELFEYTGKYSALDEDEEEPSSSLFVEGQAFVKILSSTDKRLPTGSVYDFADANKLFNEADLEQRMNRDMPGYSGEWCGKVRYGIYMRSDGEDYEFTARYDTGDGDGTLLEHLESLGAVFYNVRTASESAKSAIAEANEYRKDLIPLLSALVDTAETENENAEMTAEATDSAVVFNEPEILWGEDDIQSDWFTESELLSDFVEEHGDVSFALANKLIEYLDEKQHIERLDDKHGWYKKTFFRVIANIDGQDYSYLVRFDIGDGKGTGGGSIIDHIRDFNQGVLESERYPHNSPESKDEAQRILNIFIPELEKHSELSEEEQRIFDEFVASHPIEGIEDEQNDDKRKIENFKKATDGLFQSAHIGGLRPQEIEETVREHIRQIFNDGEIDAQIVDLAISGSRSRGLENKNSDLDIAVELSTDIKEDSLFNILHEQPFEIRGVTVDINPIRQEQTGTLGAYLENAEKTIVENYANHLSDKDSEPQDELEEKETEQKYIYKMEANPRRNNADDSFLVQSYLPSKNGKLEIGNVVFVGAEEKCRELAKQLNGEEWFDPVKYADKNIPFFGNTATINELLRTTPYLKVTKDEIDAFFESHPENEERTEFIRNIFNDDFTEINLNDGSRVGYKKWENVLQMWKGSFLSREAQSFYDWGVIAKHYQALRLLDELTDAKATAALPSSDDGQLTLLPEEPTADKPVEFTFSQKIIDAVLQRGSNISGWQTRFYEQFEKKQTLQENAEFLEKEYGDGGIYPAIIGTEISEDYDSKGIHISNGFGEDKAHIDLSWKQAAKRIEELIAEDKFLTPKEKEKYVKPTENENDPVERFFKKYESLPTAEKIKVIAKTFDAKDGKILTSPCYGKWRGSSDIHIVLNNGKKIFMGNRITQEAKKVKVQNEYIDGLLRSYNPEIVEYRKENAITALKKWEEIDNAIALEKGLKPYKVLSIELSKTDDHMGWYYAVLQVDNKIHGHLETGLRYSIDSGVFERRNKDYYIAGALDEKDVDYVFDNVGFSSKSTLYTAELPEEVKQKFEQEISVDQNNTQSEELFDTAEFEEHISDNMRFKEVAQVNDNEIYWITQGVFSLSELQEFQQTVRDYGGAAKKFYVTYRGVSPSYSFEDDMENKVLAVVTPDEIFSDDYIKAIENAGLEAYLYPENESEDTEDTAELEKTSDIEFVENLSQLKKTFKSGMMFEIIDHLRTEYIGEHRIVTGVNSAGFTSKRLDESGNPIGKDIYMWFNRAKNWTFDGDKMTSLQDDGKVLMSFRFVDTIEQKQTIETVTVEEVGARYSIEKTDDQQYSIQLSIKKGDEYVYIDSVKFISSLEKAHQWVWDNIIDRTIALGVEKVNYPWNDENEAELQEQKSQSEADIVPADETPEEEQGVQLQTEPTITCVWSESSVFEDGKTYSIREFDELMAAADKEQIAGQKAGIEKYGSWEQLYESDDEEYIRFLGYDKVKFTVNMPDGSKITERQDIGDGFGGVIDFLRKCGYEEEATMLENAAYGDDNSISIHRVGDFYEIYGKRARQTAEILDIRLTKKRGEDMCGFPAKALGDYRAKLENAGYTVRAVDDNDSAETTQLSLFDNEIREAEKKDEPKYTTVVINAFGGAGAGKTTACLHITAELKKRGYVAEFVPEYAKELVWEKKYDLLNGEEENQKNLLIEMQKRIDRVVGNCDFAITDSPLLLNGVYLKNAKDKDAYWNDLINEINKYNNFNFVVQRDVSKFEQAGRIHTLEQSIEIDGQIENLLREKNMEFSKYDHSHLDDVIDNAIKTLESLQKQNVQPTIEEKPQEKAPITANFHLSPGESINYAKGAKAKYADNVSAIRTLKLIEREKRTATPEEQKILAKYLGWGGLSDAFDEHKENWHKEYVELKTLLSDKEYKSAFYSTNSAFYTDPEIIRPIWAALQRFGFKGGEVLEPSMGTGNFFSVIPPEIAQNSHLHGVELDTISGRIAKLLYPDADIKINGYQNVYIDDDSIDVAIGNVPFEEVSIHDDRYERAYLLHDYFFIRTMDILKPGGIAAFITSTGTFDKNDSAARRAIAEKADLIGAIRLPDSAFKAIAGTETATDILFFQKRERERYLDWQSLYNPALHWLETGTVREYNYNYNNYFIEKPEMILAEFNKKASGWAASKWKAKENSDLYQDLDEALHKLNAEFSAAPTLPEIEEDEEDNSIVKIDAPNDAENFCYYIHDDGDLYYRENEYLVKFSGAKKTEDRIKDMVRVSDKLSQVINAQLAGDESLIKSSQQGLNDEYDAFVKKHGYLNDNANSSAFREDTKNALLMAIEREMPDGSYEKADIFTQVTIAPVHKIEKAENAQEALIISLNMRGAVDTSYMASLLDSSEEEVIAELGDSIFYDPAGGGWSTAEEYLSGDVVTKLETAKMWAEDRPEIFSRNVEALQNVQPTRIGIEDINFDMGQLFIPKDFYEDFCYDKFGRRPGSFLCSVEINYVDVLSAWRVSGQSSYNYEEKINSVYGTERASAWTLLEKSLNQQRVTIKDAVTVEGANGQKVKKYVVNDKETKIARARQRKIESEFKDWILSDDKRVKTIEDRYNDRYNRLVQRQYDGSNIRINGLAQDMTLRPHQLNAVAKIAAGGCVMLAHEVGAGKTATMAAAGMYLQQIGAVRKPLYVVPKAIVTQWGREFARFFPTAKVLVTSEKDFEKKNRRRFLGKISTGNYDAIVMSHEQFEKIPLSKNRQLTYIEQKKKEIEDAKDEIRRNLDKRGLSVKELARRSKMLDEKIEKLKAEKKKDNFINFEEFGCDYIFVDEAHKYKNLGVETQHNNVAGLSASVISQRAFDMEMKVKYLQEINGGGGVTFATGTPLSNSISECFVFQHFLQPDLLKEAQIDKFDRWAAIFSEIDMQFEAKPTGDGYKQRERFTAFKNLFELSTMLSESFDIVKNAEVSEIELPTIKGGKPEMVICEQSEDQAIQVEEAMERARAIEEKRVDPHLDNMLAICTDMTKISLDPRIRNPKAKDDEGLKANQCVQNILEIDNEHPGTTQVVFCDTNVPHDDDTFSIYTEIKNKLIQSGKYTADEVRFICDAKNDKERLAMFDKINAGEIRVIIGSTEKLGTGVNIQRKLVAAHHLDAPYVPKDVEQRNGRIVRQGNENKEVRVLYYSTKGTFDSYRWQLLEKKQRLISQIMSGKPVSRRCQDIDDVAMTYAEMKAATAGNPLIAEKMSLENEIETLNLLKREFLAKQRDYKQKIEEQYPTEIQKIEKRIDQLNSDIDIVKKNPLPEDGFRITIGDKEYADRSEAGKQILAKWNDYRNSDQYESSKTSGKIGAFRGLDVHFTSVVTGIITQSVVPGIQLRGKSGLAHEKDFTMSPVGVCLRLENMANALTDKLERTKKQLESVNKNLETCKKEYGKPWEEEARLNKLLERLDDVNMELAPSSPDAEITNDENVTEQTVDVR